MIIVRFLQLEGVIVHMVDERAAAGLGNIIIDEIVPAFLVFA